MYIMLTDTFGGLLRVAEPKENIHDLPKLLKGYGIDYCSTENHGLLIMRAEWERPEDEDFVSNLMLAYGLKCGTWNEYISAQKSDGGATCIS